MKAIFPIVALLAVGIPAAAAVVWIKKTHAKKLPVLVGALTFFVFVYILENILHTLCLAGDNPVARFINGNAFVLALYGGLAAGVFEETGRFVAFKTLLKRHDAMETAVSYGIGHGGIESVLLLGVNYVVLAIAAFSIGTPAQAQFEAVIPSVQAVMQSPGLCAVAVLERVFAMTFHVGASILVFIAARDRSRIVLYPLAILLHAALDFPAMFYKLGFIPLGVLEVLVAVYSAAVLFFAVRLYKARKSAQESNTAQ